MAKKKESTRGENLAQQIIEQYNPKSVADMQNALKDIFGPMFEAMLKGEMNHHLGYENNDHGSKTTANRRNGYIAFDFRYILFAFWYNLRLEAAISIAWNFNLYLSA